VYKIAFSALMLLAGRWKEIRPVKTKWWYIGMVICLERGANDLSGKIKSPDISTDTAVWQIPDQQHRTKISSTNPNPNPNPSTNPNPIYNPNANPNPNRFWVQYATSSDCWYGACACVAGQSDKHASQLTYIIGPSTGHNTALRAVCRYWPAEG